MRKALQFDVFGQRVIVEYSMDNWKVYYVGDDGKRRPADIAIPSHYTVADIAQYFDDMFHETAIEKIPKYKNLSDRYWL